MKYNIDKTLRRIAIKIPFNRIMIFLSNIFIPLMNIFIRLPKELKCNKIKINNTKTIIYTPSIHNKSCILYIHGGGFAYKGSFYHKKLCIEYAIKTNSILFYPDYHLLPKYKYPYQINEIIDVYNFIISNYEKYNIDINKISIIGDSAGGFLAGKLCNYLVTNNKPLPTSQLLIYPVVDNKQNTNSMKKYYDTPLWNSKNNQKMWSMYLADIDSSNTKVSLLDDTIVKSNILTYIETTEYDSLHDEGILYKDKLINIGNYVELNDTLKTFHGYDMLINNDIVKQNINKRINFINKSFEK